MTAPVQRRIHYVDGHWQVMAHPDGGREPGVPVGPSWEDVRDSHAYYHALEHKGPVSPLRGEDERVSILR
jgi:hypothetical protein